MAALKNALATVDMLKQAGAEDLAADDLYIACLELQKRSTMPVQNEP